MEDKITGALQENLLTLLCFDAEAAPIIKNTIEVGLYSSDIFREVAYEAVDFHDTFGEPIGNHLPDAFEDVINGTDRRKGNLYRSVVTNLYATKDSINKEYVMSKLSRFVRDQQVTKAVTQAAKHLRGGDTEAAEEELLKGLRNQQLHAFDPGMFLSDSPIRVMKHLRSKTDFCSIGIPSFDEISLGPTRKELMTILGPTSKGKTWMFIHIGKHALLQQKNVLHLTLEMSEEKIMTRYYQALLSISRRKAINRVANLSFNKKGRFDGLEFSKVIRPTFKSKGLSRIIKKRTPSVLKRYRLLVKQFPTGTLTMKQLEAYLDNLDRENGFVPDVILLDYADLMKIDPRFLRIETGIVFKNLRGLMVERNIAGVTASQSNRAADDIKWVTLKHLAEDYSKAGTSDIVVTICQSINERRKGILRLFVPKNRDEEDNVTVLCTQGLSFGQFVLDSHRLEMRDADDYWSEVEQVDI